MGMGLYVWEPLTQVHYAAKFGGLRNCGRGVKMLRGVHCIV